ncbi:MAG: GNAT family N-acetyltransferase [Chloroflexi bacterium]|nr:GNAT family N-acetyltransferase [Chloroflexota bacterium]
MVEIIPASEAEHDRLLRNLYQFYLYEFSRLGPDWRVQEDGRFDESDLDDCWEPGCRRIFMIRVDGAWAGFIIVDLDLPDGDNPPVNEMSEFFVMPPYRRQGVGETAARWAFDQFPGRWEVAIVDSNAEALAFWRRVLARYPADPVAEVHRPEERDYLLAFDNSPN